MKINNILSLLPMLLAAMFVAGAAPLTLESSQVPAPDREVSFESKIAADVVFRNVSSSAFARSGVVELNSPDDLNDPAVPVKPPVTPEPATMVLIGFGLLGMALVVRRASSARGLV